MKIRVVSKFLGFFSCIITICIALPLSYSALYSREAFMPLGAALIVGALVSAVLLLFGRGVDLASMRQRESMASVTLAWLIASLIGAIPYMLHGAAPTAADAFFEAMSGFTTTGATILSDVDHLPRGLLLWRSITHWLGGMGVIVLALTIMPIAGVGGYNLYVAEVPGLDSERMTPRVRQTAVILWLIYLGLTCLLCLMLILFGMDMFDAVNHAMSAISTGGFAPHSDTFSYMSTPLIEWTFTIFMFLAGTNFALYYQAMRGRSLRTFFRDPEFVFYLKVVSGATISIAIYLFASGTYGSLGECLRHSAFQVNSFISTAGFISADYDMWPSFCQGVLFLTLFIGGCAGSTAGGLKQMRVLIYFRHAGRQLAHVLDPRAVIPIRMGAKSMSPKDVSSTLAFLGLFLFTLGGGIFAVSFFEDDFVTAVSGAATCLGCVGPAFGTLGSSGSFAPLAAGAKLIYSFLMLCGRLELYTVLILFTGSFWSDGIDLSDGRMRRR